jgi:hypothetical protein
VDIVRQIQALGLPGRQYIVIGSGPLVALSIIPYGNDIDLAVSPELYAYLRKAGWEEHEGPGGKPVLARGDFDVGVGYGDWSLEQLLEDAFFIDGVPFTSIDKVTAWKRAKNRPKDAEHIRLIEAYLANHQAA